MTGMTDRRYQQALTQQDGDTLDAYAAHDARHHGLPTHCMCPQCHPGLTGTQPPATHNQPTRLHIVTPGPPVKQPTCDGTYTCGCPNCLNNREPARIGTPRQPWQARPSRHARAA